MSDDTLTRRKTMKLGAVVAGAGLASGAGVILGSKPVFAIQDRSFSAADVTGLSSNSGNVQDVYIQPSLTCEWDGVDTEPNSITCEVFVDTPTSVGANGSSTTEMESIGTKTVSSLSGLEGTADVNWGSQWSLISDGSWSKADFKAPNNGTSASQQTTGPIEVLVQATFDTDAQSYTDEARDSFSVTVENQGAGATVGGNAGTGGSA